MDEKEKDRKRRIRRIAVVVLLILMLVYLFGVRPAVNRWLEDSIHVHFPERNVEQSLYVEEH